MNDTFRIVRFHFNGGKSIGTDREGGELPSGITLEEAKDHCNGLDTASDTATSPEAVEYTRKYGRWFDGFEAEDGRPLPTYTAPVPLTEQRELLADDPPPLELR